MKNTTAVSVVFKKKKILIIKDREGKWTLPGGIDKKETKWMAAKREVLEETNLKIKIKKRIRETEKYSKGKIKLHVMQA